MIKKMLQHPTSTWAGALAAMVAGGLFMAQPASALGTSHSSFTIKKILPTEMNSTLGLGGIDFLPNGDGVICTWGGSQKSTGELWIVSKLATGTPGTATRIATGLREPLGIKVVGNDFYMMEKPGIVKYTGSGTTWTRSNFFSLPTAWYTDSQWHHFSFGLVLRDSALWFTTGTAYDYTPTDPIQRGALIKVPLSGGGFTQHARGLRNVNGLGIGPEDEFFATDNQGHYKPADYLYYLPTKNTPTNGRFYGFRTNGNNACGTKQQIVGTEVCPEDPEYPPAIWIPYGNFSNSPLRPVLLKKGPYAGQMISGDVYHGGILRYFLERVGGEYQGAVFSFINGGSGDNNISYGINQFIYTPTGDLIAIGIGNGCANQGGSGNWSYNGSCRGMHLFTHTDQAPFEMKAIRSTPTGFQIEFTKPANAAAGQASSYSVKTTVFTPFQEYGKDGGPNDNNITVNVTEAKLSTDGLYADIKLASLSTKRMYAITMTGVTSQSGEAAYTNVGYYTLNNVATKDPVGVQGHVQPAKPFGSLVRFDGSHRQIQVLAQAPYQLSLKSADGREVAQILGDKPQTHALPALEAGVYLLTGRMGEDRYAERLVLR